MKNKNSIVIILGIVVIIFGVIQALKPEAINAADSGFPLGNIAGVIPQKFVLFLGAVVLAIGGFFYMAEPTKQ